MRVFAGFRRACPALLLFAAALTASTAGYAQAPRALPPVRQLVLLLAPGASLRDWQSADAPHLNRLLAAANVAVMPTRAGGAEDLPTAYRALAAGSRSPSAGRPDLGAALRAAGVVVVARGPDAEIVAGLSPNNEGEAYRIRDAAAPFGVATDDVRFADAVARDCSSPPGRRLLVVATFDDLVRADTYAAVALPRATAEQRRAALRRLDRLVARLTERTSGVALLVVTPRPSAAAVARGERLGQVLLWQPGDFASDAVARGALLTSPSTRRTPGLVAATDIAATVAALLGVPAEPARVGAGRPLERVAVPGGAPATTYLNRRVAAMSAQAREQRLLIYVPWLLAAALIFPLWRRVPRANLWAVWAASVPLALWLAAPLAPNAPGRAGFVYALALVWSLIPPVLATRFPARNVFHGVAALTTLTLVLDTLLGAPLLGRSPLSYSPVEAARFYGIGNEASGVLIGASLVAASRGGAVGALLIGVVVAGTLSLPQLGADFGGLLAALAGFAALVLGLRPVPKRRVAWRRATLLGIAVIGVALTLMFWDASRGAGTRTHIGEALAAARERGGGAVGEIALRKLRVNARLLVTSPWAVLLLAEVATGAAFLRRRRLQPQPIEEAAALRAVGVAAGALLLLNDSGVVAAATCLLFAVPLLALAQNSRGR